MRRWRQPASARPILPTPRHSGLGANNAIPVGPLYCSGSNRLIGIVGGNRRSADNARAVALTGTCHPVVNGSSYDLLM